MPPSQNEPVDATRAAAGPWPGDAARVPEPARPGPEAEALARELGLSYTMAEALRAMGYGADERTRRFLAPRLADLTVPDAMAGLPEAVACLASAVRQRQRIVVFGDYDCDGITATAILVDALGALGGLVEPLLASRFGGGYGLSDRALDLVLERRPAVLVTCDCGSSDGERLERARAAGVRCVVVDHHLVPADALAVEAFINPHQPSCGHAYKHLASCGLCLVVAAALRRELGVELDLRRWLDLVAIGTIADVAPLDGDNRILVRAGLSALARPARPGLGALVDRAQGGRARPVRAEDVGFQIGPRINAPGRLGSPMVALRLLLENDPVRAAELAARVEEIAVERKRLQATLLSEALADVARGSWAGDGAIVAARAGWHPGIVGIVAGRLAAELGRPTAVLAIDGEAARGSARAPAGFPLYDSLEACASELLKFGGHQAAAGLEIASTKVDSFRQSWARACEAIAGDPARWLDVQRPARVVLDERDDPQQVVTDLERLEPCGHGNPAPQIVLRGAKVRSARDVRGHLRMDLELAGRPMGAFGPGRGADAVGLAGSRITAVGKLRRDTYRGGDALEILVDELTVT